ncbi:hypothetical protein FB566_3090 [Stackebrandtia endophytica]|uniref:Uncharacterized protein n=1 Tax=Stackebrandtia endophytica TaxID=1496996 RepID=A0A543AY79_9ACTN|nr:hypothetical protein [Stackebrandtia endophytica]TQL77531.1 hypothetical protein FB566_3090 [Stackebrandtia endophytica]
MSKTTITVEDVIYIRWGKRIRQRHRAVRRGFRRVCSHCGRPWGRNGCAEYLWATDFLSQFSLIVLPDRPSRPKRRHTPTYTATLNQVAADIARAYRRYVTGRPLPV